MPGYYEDDYDRSLDDERDPDAWDDDDDDADGPTGADFDDDLIDGVGFADPGGVSALRAETENNPRDQPCPTCGRKNVLTRIDRQRGYQCDQCANRAEGRMGGDY